MSTPSTRATLIAAVRSDLTKAFAEWERRFREDPTQYASDMEKLAMTTDSYGEQCADYLIQLLSEVAQS